MENIFDNVLKSEVITTITEDTVNDYIKNLTEFITNFYTRKKILGYTSLVLLLLALPFYKKTNGLLPSNDSFIVYCAVLILIVGTPTLVWSNMNTEFRKSKINTLEVLNYTVQSYFENGAKQLNVSINFNVKEYKEKEDSSNFRSDYVTINTINNLVNYNTSLYITTFHSRSFGRIPAQNRNGIKTTIKYYLHLETICAVPKIGNELINIPFKDNGIQTTSADALHTFNYNFKTVGKLHPSIVNFFTKPFVKSYFDYIKQSIKK